jgi:hypothetical protein
MGAAGGGGGFERRGRHCSGRIAGRRIGTVLCRVQGTRVVVLSNPRTQAPQ